MEDALKELQKFLQIGARLDLKAVALENLLGVTATAGGVKTIAESPALLACLVSLLCDNNVSVARNAAACLINVSADEFGAEKLLKTDLSGYAAPLHSPPGDLIETAAKFILDTDSAIADSCCVLLSNLSRPENCAEIVAARIEKLGLLARLTGAFIDVKHNRQGCGLHNIAALLANLSQSADLRRALLKNNLLTNLLPFIDYKESSVRRSGIAALVKNCCFDVDFQDSLLDEDVDVLPRLLYPLAGGEEYDEEDNDKLPMELQYLPEDKERESDASIRRTLIEALLQLCAKRKNRIFIREKNAYVILRDLHKKEEDKQVLLACENVIDVLIRTEEEIGEDNLRDLTVSDELRDKFRAMDQEFLSTS